VTFEKANVVHMGDLLFNRIYPVVDRPSGASFRHWITVLEEAAKTYPSDAIYVFGHGSAKYGVTGQRGDLLVFRDYIAALLAHVEKQIAAGEPKTKIAALENLPGFPDFHLPLPNRLSGNLGAAYDELTEKKS
jgi:glyoxylase-like metal-dependent hydrolase (beta-lactamase superfamily II)